MPVWKHDLKIKGLLQPYATDHDAVAREIGPQVAERVRSLAGRVRAKDDILAEDLEEIAGHFADTPEADEPKQHFNWVLSDLYDLGDRERIWIA